MMTNMLLQSKARLKKWVEVNLPTAQRMKIDKRGVAAVEFSIIAPILVALYIGAVELTEGVTLQRRVTNASNTVGDLTAQGININNKEMAEIFKAGESVIQPYGTSKFAVRVSNIIIDADKKVKVGWSEGIRMPKREPGSPITIPTELMIPSTTLIYAEAGYSYTPVVSKFLVGTTNIQKNFFLKPRYVTEVKRVYE